MSKKLEINERGIILWEENEILNQGIYREKKDILYEVYDVISVIDELGKIELDIKIELEEDIRESIKDLLINKKGVIKEKEKIEFSNRLKILTIGVILTEILIGVILFIKVFEIEEEINRIKKDNKISIVKIEKNSNKIKEIKKEDTVRYIFLKNNIAELLLFFSNVFFKKGCLNSFEILDKKIIINGFSSNLKEVIEIRKNIENHKRIKESKLDYIKREGEYLFYLMELKIE